MLKPTRIAAVGFLVTCLLIPGWLNAADEQDQWTIADKGTLRGTLLLSGKATRYPVVIYLERSGGSITFKPPEAQTIGQLGAKFKPKFSVVTLGQEVIFDNDEAKKIDHNVYTRGVEQKDFGIFARGQTVKHVFQKSGAINLHCSIHKLMNGKVFVAPTPAFFVVPPKSESFVIRDIPVGRWTLRTHQLFKRYHEANIEIVISKDGTTEKDVELKR